MSHIVVAPFSNSDIRDWPTGHFATLLGLLRERLPAGARLRVVGTANQRLRANEIVRVHPAPQVSNDCGRHDWPALAALIRSADCLIGNNSGIGHLAAMEGVPLVSIFGGSHQRHEWRAIGAHVTLVSRAIGCSPCQLDHGRHSPYAKACLRLIAPETVAEATLALLGRMSGDQAATGASPNPHGAIEDV